MARIKLGPLITDISGSIGMATIQRNRFGHTLRLKPLPKKSETPAQYTIRRHMITIQAAWQSLTDAERLQWDRFINFSGQTIRKDKSVLLSGHKLYLKYQLFRLMYDQSLLTTIVYAPMPSFSLFVTVGEEFGNFYIHFDSPVVHTSYFFICKLTSPRHANQAFSPRGLRFMKVYFNTSGTFLINALYLSAFGALPAVDDTLHFSVQYFSITSPVFSGVFTGITKVLAT